jgi:hypothetical protein
VSCPVRGRAVTTGATSGVGGGDLNCRAADIEWSDDHGSKPTAVERAKTEWRERLFQAFRI